jgi:hypothetical protein
MAISLFTNRSTSLLGEKKKDIVHNMCRPGQCHGLGEPKSNLRSSSGEDAQQPQHLQFDFQELNLGSTRQLLYDSASFVIFHISIKIMNLQATYKLSNPSVHVVLSLMVHAPNCLPHK